MYLEHDKLLEKMHADNELERNELEQEKVELSEKIEKVLKLHKQQREDTENNKWEEIEAIKEKNKEELAERVDKSMQEKASLTLISNELQQHKNKAKGLQNQIEEMDKKLKDEVQEAQTKRATLKSQNNELGERDSTIREKDGKIRELHSKTQELEKFKFVLDYKIKELKREIGPREDLIQDLNEQNTKMRQEQKFFARMSSNLKLIQKDLELKFKGLELEARKLMSVMDQQEAEKAEFRESIFNCLKNLSDYKKLKQGIVDLHKVYVNGKQEEDDSDIY